MPRILPLLVALSLITAPTAASADTACLKSPTPECLIAMAMQLRPTAAAPGDGEASSYDRQIISALARAEGPDAARTFGRASPHIDDPFLVERAIAQGLAAAGRVDEVLAMTAAWKAEGREAAHVEHVAWLLGHNRQTEALRALLGNWRQDQGDWNVVTNAALGLIEGGHPGAPDLLLEEADKRDDDMVWAFVPVWYLVAAGQAEEALPVVRRMPVKGIETPVRARVALALGDRELAAQVEAHIDRFKDPGRRNFMLAQYAVVRLIGADENAATSGLNLSDPNDRIVLHATVTAALGGKAFTAPKVVDASLRFIRDDKAHDKAIVAAVQNIDTLLPFNAYADELSMRLRNPAIRDGILSGLSVAAHRLRPDLAETRARLIADPRIRSHAMSLAARGHGTRGDHARALALAVEEVDDPQHRGTVFLDLALLMR